ncbi:MAG: hypothetical protein FD129_2175 [bacterium]|nr:MAG: hypothetical protein FD129_2175 [bacterium]
MNANIHPTASRWNRLALFVTLSLVAALGSARLALAQALCPGDMGSAPDGILAYSNVNGVPVTGQFPTRRDGPNGYALFTAVPDNERCFFGWGLDYEVDAIPAGCPSGSYYVDELDPPSQCEIGLVGPVLYTFDASGMEVPLAGTGPNPFLGTPGTLARWGQGPGDNLDLFVQNASGDTAYLNMLVDWDQDGTWGVNGQFQRPSQMTPASAGGRAVDGGSVKANSHLVLAQLWNRSVYNFPVPPYFTGYLSVLQAPGFPIGGNGGYHWARFTISRFMLPSNWNGGGQYPGGAVHDFVLRNPPGGGGGAVHDFVLRNPPGGGTEEIGCEFGDAPDGALAYSSAPLIGDFPTCMLGPNGYIVHTGLTGEMRFGFYEDQESNGNSDDCAFSIYDNDELFNDGDAGLMFPSPFSMGPPEYAAGPFGSDHELGTGCSSVQWGTEIDIQYVNNTLHEAYINVIFDFDGNGEWGGQFTCYPGPLLVVEHAVRNVKVSAPSSGTLSGVLNALGQGYTAVGGERFVWARFTISEFPVPQDWDGAGIFGDGETEDYLFKIGAPLPAPGGPVTLTSTVPVTWDPGASIIISSEPCAAGIRAYSDVNGFARDGNFPTHRYGLNGSMLHGANPPDENCFIGQEVDFEWDATGTCAASGHETDEPLAADDCDPGLHGPQTYTIDTSGLEVPTAFYPGSEPFLGTGSSQVPWGQGPGEIDLYVQNTRGALAFVNVVIDFDRDGDWDVFTAPQIRGRLDAASPNPGELTASNRAATNIPVPGGYVGWLSGLAPPPLNLTGAGGFAWARFTITNSPISTSWNGSGSFPFGESEDYLLRLNPAASSGVIEPVTVAGLRLAQNVPNPVRWSTIRLNRAPSRSSGMAGMSRDPRFRRGSTSIG